MSALDGLLANSDASVWAMAVKDRFAPYGLVGICVVRGDRVENISISCRTIGLAIEQPFLATVLAQTVVVTDQVLAAIFTPCDRRSTFQPQRRRIFVSPRCAIHHKRAKPNVRYMLPLRALGVDNLEQPVQRASPRVDRVGGVSAHRLQDRETEALIEAREEQHLGLGVQLDDALLRRTLPPRPPRPWSSAPTCAPLSFPERGGCGR